MSSVRLGSYDPSAGDPLDPNARQGETVLPPTVVGGQAPDAAPAGPTSPGPQVDENGKWDMGYTMPIPKPGRGPEPTYDADVTEGGAQPAQSQRASIAQNDTEKKAHFDALRELFGLAPDPKAQPQAQPVHPDATAHPDSPEFKAWLRSAPPEEFEKWMMNGGQTQPVAPTEAAIAKARAALAPPMTAGELSQQAAALPAPSPPPTTDPATLDARRYQTSLGGQMSPAEQAEMFKSLAKKYEDKKYNEDFEKQVAHAQQRALAGGTNGAMTPLEQAEAIKRLAAQKQPGLAERAYNALPGPSMAQSHAAMSGAVPMAQKGVAAAVQPTMMNDLAGRGWKLDPRTGEYDAGAPIVSPEEQARQIGELLRKQTPEQAKAARDKAFLDALNGGR